MKEINELYYKNRLNDCEKLIFDIIDNYDENIILNQQVTMHIPSIYYIYAKIIFIRHRDVHSFEYRSFMSMKYLKLALKSFVLGKMYDIYFFIYALGLFYS